MTEQTITELTNFFQKFAKEDAKQPMQSNVNVKSFGVF